jgi:phosphate transport system substrate-binding protein
MEFHSVNSFSTRHKVMAASLVAVLALAACGDDDDAADTTEAAPATEAAGTESPAATTAVPAGTTAGSEGTTAGSEVTTAGAEGSTSGSEGTTGNSAAAGEVELAGGEVFVSGSSTVEPISIRVGELAGQQSGGALAVTVEGPGTGDGFQLFCAGESDVSDASRPINDDEVALCEQNGIEYVELEIGIDGLTVATNPANDAITCLDIPALYALIGPESEGTSNWSDASELATEVGSAYADAFPDLPLAIYGPGEESGTYDTFVEFAISDLAEERGQDDATRADYSSSANDNLIVEGIEGSESSLGWVGFAYYLAEQDRMKAIEIDGGDGCVAPTQDTIGDGTYPFSRSLYIYVNTAKAEDNPAVASFVDLYLSDAGIASVSDAGYVSLPADRIQASRDAWANR